jgi:hypothetical protein
MAMQPVITKRLGTGGGCLVRPAGALVLHGRLPHLRVLFVAALLLGLVGGARGWRRGLRKGLHNEIPEEQPAAPARRVL